ncbi:hypothetical protein CRG98_020911 [Punica granatum]|uniref:Uncharacterized protein n=1 Tax=Punica granatum TaxID=22663 RepID=A0A2I0JS47_PUNGR|nr:hypothetical protein CRG98_020911 [Punica granatum]
MSPRRTERVDDVLDGDNLQHLKKRLEQIVDQRMDRMMEQLTQMMAALMRNQNRGNPNLDQDESSEDLEGENYIVDIPHRQSRGPIEDNKKRPIEDNWRYWESGM